MKRNILSVLIIALACIGMAGVAWAANDRYYTAVISPNNVTPGGLPTNFNLSLTNNILSGPSHFIRQIVITVPSGFTITGTVTVQAPSSAPLPWKATRSGNTITVVSGSTSDASVTAGQSVTVTVPATAPSIGCPGGNYLWGITASQVIGGGGAGNAYLQRPGSPDPIVHVTCDTQTSLTLGISPDSIITTDAAAMVTLTSTLTKTIDGSPLSNEPITFTVGGEQVSCIGGPIYTNVSGIAACSYYPQASPNTPLPSGVYDCFASFAGDASFSPHLGSSGAGPEKLNVNATGTGLDVSSLSVPYSTSSQPVTLTATLTGLGQPLAGKTVSFTLGSTSAGTGTTNNSGVATVSATLPGSLSPGTYTSYIKANFAADNTYAAAAGDAPLTVGPIAATISFDPATMTQTYTGGPLAPTVVTNPPGLSYSVSNLPKTNAGSYQVSATVTDPSYSGTTGNQTFTILQANATINITPYSVDYDTNPHSGNSGTATGVQGEDLSSGLTIPVTPHTNAGTYNDSWSFNGGVNYVSTSGTVANTIKKVGSSVSVIGGTFPYDGSAHAATGSASTTVGSLTLPATVVISYSGSCTVAPTTVAEGTTCTATGTYSGDANHTGSSNTANITITKAGQTINFTSMVVSATATSGGTVSFSTSTPTFCTVVPVSDGKALVTLTSGTWAQCSVQADQSGTGNYGPAPQATAVLTAP